MRKKACFCEKGTATVEFVIVLPAFLVMLFASLLFVETSVLSFKAIEYSEIFSRNSGIQTLDDLGVKFTYDNQDDELDIEEFTDDYSTPWNYTEDDINDALVTAAYEARTYYEFDEDSGSMVPVTRDMIVIPGLSDARIDYYQTLSPIADELLEGWGAECETRIVLNYIPFYLQDAIIDVDGVALAESCRSYTKNPLFIRERGTSEYQPIMDIVKEIYPSAPFDGTMPEPMEESSSFWGVN